MGQCTLDQEYEENPLQGRSNKRPRENDKYDEERSLKHQKVDSERVFRDNIYDNTLTQSRAADEANIQHQPDAGAESDSLPRASRRRACEDDDKDEEDS